MKKFINVLTAIILAVLLLTSPIMAQEALIMPISNDTAPLFSDISGHWAENVIIKYKDSGIVSGYPDGTFRPDAPITRAEFAKIIDSAFSLEKTGDLTKYNDISAEAWYHKHLTTASGYIPNFLPPHSYEVTAMYGNHDNFLPDSPILRCHAAAAFSEIYLEKNETELRELTIQEVKSELNEVYKDIEFTELFATHTGIADNVKALFNSAWCARELGIMLGNADGYFKPYSSLTRAEVLTVIDRIKSVEQKEILLNGRSIKDYSIVFSTSETDYNSRAATYIHDEIKELTGFDLKLKSDNSAPDGPEIIVGETTRKLSKLLDADTKGLEFAFLADSTGVAMEGDYFVIAAAAYYFVDTYIENADAKEVPATVTVQTPIMEEANNYIFLIGDGMGQNQTKLFDYLDVPANAFTDGEDVFYAHMLPNIGLAKTNSYSGTTDSAASGTALATGYKTINGYVGKNQDKNDIQSLTELADSLGKATAVMSTEAVTGATPAAFSAHANDRNDTATIASSQKLLENTIIKSTNNTYSHDSYSKTIDDVLKKLDADPEGFFIMYEEAYIDKNSHSNDLNMTFSTLIRFNQAIGQFMEYAFYNPDTMVIITADHETGALTLDSTGKLQYLSTNHSAADVYVFAYGEGCEVFDDQTIQNVQIAKTIAKFWGVDDFGDTSSPFKALN